MTSVAREPVSAGPAAPSACGSTAGSGSTTESPSASGLSATGSHSASDAAELCSSDELARAWKTVVRGYTHVTDLLTEQVERETGLPAPAFFALVWLLRDGSGSAVPLSKLARQVAFTSGGFTKVADRLEQAGLIQRQASVSDRRVTHAVLTESGRALAERAFGIYCEGLRELVVERLGLDGLHVLADHMQRLSGDKPE